MQLHNPVNRQALGESGSSVSNPEFSNIVAGNPTFASLAQELTHLREVQAMKQFFIYNLSGYVNGGASEVFHINIEQGSDFLIQFMTASAYSWDATVGFESWFPIPNTVGATEWAGRGLSAKITDSMAGRELTSGFVPFECFGTPGYGLNFQSVFPIRYLAYRNSKIRFDIRCRDNPARVYNTDVPRDPTNSGEHQFEICLGGYKIFTPQ
jgi:hypothetical protein